MSVTKISPATEVYRFGVSAEQSADIIALFNSYSTQEVKPHGWFIPKEIATRWQPNKPNEVQCFRDNLMDLMHILIEHAQATPSALDQLLDADCYHLIPGRLESRDVASQTARDIAEILDINFLALLTNQ